eukprot:1606958-Rhodomonas_salina.1
MRCPVLTYRLCCYLVARREDKKAREQAVQELEAKLRASPDESSEGEEEGEEGEYGWWGEAGSKELETDLIVGGPNATEMVCATALRYYLPAPCPADVA